MQTQRWQGWLISLLSIFWAALPAAALEVTPGVDAARLAEALRGAGITILAETISYQGTSAAAGIFSGGGASGLGLEAGLVIRSDPPESGNLPGLNILDFDFETVTNDLFCRYLLASEEYTADGAPLYPDLVKLYVDGEQIALLSDNVTPVSLSTVNATQNRASFQNISSQQFDHPYSGFTRVFTAAARDLEPGTHHLRILVMNEGELQKQSAILLEQGSCSAYGLHMADVEADENAGALTFTVNLSQPAPTLVNFDYQTADDTATEGSDYTGASGTSGIAAGSQAVQLTVPITDDLLAEDDETIFVKLSHSVNATLITPEGIGTIRDNEGLTALAITDATAEEETQQMTFTVSLSAPSSQEVSVTYSTVDDTAKAGEDYTAAQGTLTIPAGVTVQTIAVAITLDEARTEDDETFFVALSNPENAVLANEQGTGTIQNTPGGMINRMLGHPIPEPSTLVLLMLGLFGIGWLMRRRK